MSRRGVKLLALGILLAVALVGLLGGPEQSGSLAGLQGSGPSAAAGVLWIVLVPVAYALVPALAITAAAEGLHAIWETRRSRRTSVGLGSRCGPGDT